MTRKEFEALVFDTYNVRADYPFEDDLVTGVFRHENGKWFALAMNIEERKIAHSGDEKIDVVNLKCAPEIIESLAGIEPGIYRAYHMNKVHWISVLLPDAEDGLIDLLVNASYEATRGKKHRRNV